MFTEITKDDLAKLIEEMVKAALAEDRAVNTPPPKGIMELSPSEFKALLEKELRAAQEAKSNPKKGA